MVHQNRDHVSKEEEFLSPHIFIFRQGCGPKVSFFMTMSITYCLLQNLGSTEKVLLK